MSGTNNAQTKRSPGQWLTIWFIVGLLASGVFGGLTDLIPELQYGSPVILFSWDFTAGNLVALIVFTLVIGKFAGQDVKRFINNEQ